MSRAKDYIIEIDADDFEYTGVFYMNGWYVVTTANTDEITVLDKNLSKFIRGVSAITSERMIYGPPIAEPQRIENIKIETWTNIERVIIYVSRFGDASSA